MEVSFSQIGSAPEFGDEGERKHTRGWNGFDPDLQTRATPVEKATPFQVADLL